MVYIACILIPLPFYPPYINVTDEVYELGQATQTLFSILTFSNDHTIVCVFRLSNLFVEWISCGICCYWAPFSVCVFLSVLSEFFLRWYSSAAKILFHSIHAGNEKWVFLCCIFKRFGGLCLVSRFKHVFVCYKCVSIYFFRNFMFSLTMCDSGSEYVIYEASPVYYHLKHTFRLVLSRSLYLSVKHSFYYAA